MPAMMGNSQYLHDTAYLAINDDKWKPPQANFAEIEWSSHFEPARRLNSLADGLQRGSMVSPAEPGTPLLVVDNLFFMLQRRIWMELVDHLKRA
jgi:hypothetical protein